MTPTTANDTNNKDDDSNSDNNENGPNNAFDVSFGSLLCSFEPQQSPTTTTTTPAITPTTTMMMKTVQTMCLTHYLGLLTMMNDNANDNKNGPNDMSNM